MKTCAVVTPWLEHLEFFTDYQYALNIGPTPQELFVIDNGSQPPLEFAHIRLDDNRGFCHASNLGLQAATADVVLFLNNDIAAADDGWLARLVEAVEPGVLVGPRLRQDEHAQVDGERIPYLDGWCLAGMREDLLELGGFDETLVEPAYYADNMLCFKARSEGFSLREVKVGLAHKVNGTSSGLEREAMQASAANALVYQDYVRGLVTV